MAQSSLPWRRLLPLGAMAALLALAYQFGNAPALSQAPDESALTAQDEPTISSPATTDAPDPLDTAPLAPAPALQDQSAGSPASSLETEKTPSPASAPAETEPVSIAPPAPTPAPSEVSTPVPPAPALSDAPPSAYNEPVSVPQNAAASSPIVPPTTPDPAPAPSTALPADSLSCTLSIRCDTLLSNLSALPAAKQALVPADGVLLSTTALSFTEGESVFDVLLRQTRAAGLHLEYSTTPLYQTAYIEGIGNLYEFDAGALSGWMYRVNGSFPHYGSSSYSLQNGDRIEWVYTCDLGTDVGGSDAAGKQQ